jgi:hypothetical protein
MKMEKIRPIESVLKRGGREMKENDGGGDEFKIYCKHFCKHHKGPPVQQKHANKNFQRK